METVENINMCKKCKHFQKLNEENNSYTCSNVEFVKYMYGQETDVDTLRYYMMVEDHMPCHGEFFEGHTFQLF